MGTYHKSVLVSEVLEYLRVRPEGTYVDATFGGGGHTRALLEADSTCKVISFDWDAIALEKNGNVLLEEFGERLTLIWANFSQIDRHLHKAGYDKVDGILADFGTSQYQLLHREGFSFASESYLDMRMSPAHQKITAAELLKKASAQQLIEIFRDLGEEPKARLIARHIVARRHIQPIRTTQQLVALVEDVIPWTKKGIHPATRVFQGLRIYINKELDHIHSFLPAALRVLNPTGRLVCISFHSLEDRLVKQFFKEQEKASMLHILTPHTVTASAQELQENPSSRSARLRAAELFHP